MLPVGTGGAARRRRRDRERLPHAAPGRPDREPRRGRCRRRGDRARRRGARRPRGRRSGRTPMPSRSLLRRGARYEPSLGAGEVAERREAWRRRAAPGRRCVRDARDRPPRRVRGGGRRTRCPRSSARSSSAPTTSSSTSRPRATASSSSSTTSSSTGSRRSAGRCVREPWRSCASTGSRRSRTCSSSPPGGSASWPRSRARGSTVATTSSRGRSRLLDRDAVVAVVLAPRDPRDATAPARAPHDAARRSRRRRSGAPPTSPGRRASTTTASRRAGLAKAHAARAPDALVYTVNEPARMLELQELGVAGIFTDLPDLARAALARRPG